MKPTSRFAFACMGCLLGAGVLFAADQASNPQASDQESPAKASHTRIIAPFTLLTDLSEDQSAKLIAIHKAEYEKEKALRAQEHADMLAVLSDDQKKELDAAIAKEDVNRKLASEERRAADAKEKASELRAQSEQMGATTQPSDSGNSH